MFDHKSYSEKALARLVKAKAKAERAAHRASAASSAAPSTTPSKAATPPIIDDSPQTPEAASAHSQATEPAESSPAKEPPVNRTELLRSKPELVGRFTRLLVPVLVDVYAASVVSHVRTKTLTGLLKAVSFLDGEDLKNALKVCNTTALFAATSDVIVSNAVRSSRQFCRFNPLIERPSDARHRCSAAGRAPVGKDDLRVQAVFP